MSKRSGGDLFNIELPRRSSRLMMKSVREEANRAFKLHQQSLAFPKPKSDSGKIGAFIFTHFSGDVGDVAKLARRNRERTLESFRSKYIYGPKNDKKTCVWSSGTRCWLDKSSGTMWIAVHGTNSICVVTKDEILDRTRLSGINGQPDICVLQNFRQSIAFEVEDLVYPSSSGSRQLSDLDHDQIIKKPFGVVSVIPGTNGVFSNHASSSMSFWHLPHPSPLKGSSVDLDEDKAISFLGEMMRSGKDFSLDETIHTAILAFQRLLRRRKLKTKEIRVCIWEGGYPYAFHLSRSKVNEHLSAIYG